MSAPKPLRKILLIVGIVAGILLVVAYIIGSRSKFVISSDPVKASRDQKTLIDGFGYPDTFVLAMDEKERLEVWSYYGLERSYTFKNGTFINDQIIDSLESLEAYPKLRPTQFKKGLSLKEANEIIDSEPTAQSELVPAIVEEAQVYSYSDQVIVGLKENKVVFVQTLPVNTE